MTRVAALVLVLVGAGCSGAAGEAPPRVDVLYPPYGLGDRSYSDAVYAGLVRASLDTDFEVASASPDDEAATTSQLRAWLDGAPAGPELLLAIGGDKAAALDARACAFGGRSVLLLDGALTPCAGAVSFVYDVYAASFLAGVAAVSLSATGRAAVVAGRSDAAVERFVRGFAAGVAHAGGTFAPVEYLSTSVDGFNAPAKAKAVAERLYQSTDVIFPVAGASAMGVFEAARAGEGRYAVGVDVDQAWLAPGAILGSVVKGLDGSVVTAIHQWVAGRFGEGIAARGVASQPAEFVFNPDFQARGQRPVEEARTAAASSAAADTEAHPW